jgi:hypothetical protein
MQYTVAYGENGEFVLLHQSLWRGRWRCTHIGEQELASKIGDMVARIRTKPRVLDRIFKHDLFSYHTPRFQREDLPSHILPIPAQKVNDLEHEIELYITAKRAGVPVDLFRRKERPQKSSYSDILSAPILESPRRGYPESIQIPDEVYVSAD